MTMLSLVGTHVLGRGTPLPHHLVGVLMHSLAVCLLISLWRRQGDGWDGLGVAAVVAFALHPAQAEAWLWINGRSDVTAGLVVTLAAWLFLPQQALSTETRPARVLTVGTGLCVVGVLAKEPALGGVAATVLASTLPWHAPPTKWLAAIATNLRAVAAAFGAGFLALGVYVAAKSWSLGGDTAFGIAGLTTPATLLARIPLLAGLALERVMVPVPMAMRLLAWDFEIGWTMVRALLALGVLGGVAALAVRGYLRATLLVAGALCTLLPTAYVVDHDWMGFDRYLYMPLALIAVALVSRPRQASTGSRREAIALVALSAVLGAALHLQSRTFASQLAWTTAIAQYQPESGAGALRVTEFHLVHGNPRLAAETLDTLPAPDRLPAAVFRSAASLWIRLGEASSAADLLEHGYAAHPHDVGIRLALMDARRFRGDWSGLLEITVPLMSNRRLCGPATDMIRQWQRAGIELDPWFVTELHALYVTSPCRDMLEPAAH